MVNVSNSNGRRRPLHTALPLLTVALALGASATGAQPAAEPPGDVPRLAGVWDGSPRARPINGPDMPWTPDNFPVLNERALAYQ